MSHSSDESASRTVEQPPPGHPTPHTNGTTQVGSVPGDGSVTEVPPCWEVPGYRVVRELARGGMGVVLLAHDEALDRAVAVKVLLPSLAGPSGADRFVQEARITARLPHPNIPPVYEVGELPDRTPFLAMKLIEGRMLADLLKGRWSPADGLPRFVGIFEQVCQAVGFAHSQGVIHRDLKPQNVMVGSFGEVQVMDWGLAKDLASRGRERPEGLRSECRRTPLAHAPGSPEETAAGTAMGTPAYMAPEQARGEWDRVGPWSDVFALGCILYDVLTGERVYGAGPADVILFRASSGMLEETLARLDGCRADAELVALARRCLSAEPTGRPADAGAVAAAVAAYRSGVESRLRAAEADRAAAEARADEQRKRRRVQVLLAGALVAVVGLLAFGLWWRDRREFEHRAEVARVEGGRKAEAAQQVAAAVVLAARLRDQHRFREAEVALDAVAEVAADHAGGPREALDSARADLAFVRDLADVRSKRLTWNPEAHKLETSSGPTGYRAAFAARGFDFSGDPDAVAALLRTSPVSRALVAALDDWAVHDPDPAVRGRLLAVLRRADPGEWLDRFRDPAVRADPMRLWWHARRVDVGAVPPSAVVALAELLEEHNLSPAPVLAAAQARHPADYDLALGLGLWYTDRDPRLAAGYYWAARAARPDDTHALGNLGAMLTRGSPPRVALAVTREAVRLTPDDSMAHFNLGCALYDCGDLDGAIAAYREANRLRPEDPEVYNNLSNALLKVGDTPGALAATRELVRLAPRSSNARNNHGLALQRSGDLEGAVGQYREAIRLNPKSVAGHVNLGIALRLRKDLDGAAAALGEAVRLNPNSAIAQFELGMAYRGLKKFREAATAFREAIRIEPRMAIAHYELGQALGWLGETAQGSAALREAARLDPGRFGHALRTPPRAVAPPPRAVNR